MPEYTDETQMPFGKHKDKKLKDVPASYLIYIEGQLRRDEWRELQTYIKKNMETLKQKAAQNGSARNNL